MVAARYHRPLLACPLMEMQFYIPSRRRPIDKKVKCSPVIHHTADASGIDWFGGCGAGPAVRHKMTKKSPTRANDFLHLSTGHLAAKITSVHVLAKDVFNIQNPLRINAKRHM